MIQLINKLKKNQKGFTLVELIVVLVILAILAAFTIPAMLGFVNDSKKKASLAEGREVYVAGQSAASEVTAKSTDGKLDVDASGTMTNGSDSETVKTKATELINGDIKEDGNIKVYITDSKPADFDARIADGNTSKVWVKTDGQVSGVRYTDSAAKYMVKIDKTTSGNSADVVDNPKATN